VTELDAVTRSPEGATFLVEAKSARVPLPFDVVLQDKVVRKLETYRRERALLEASIGAPIDRVVFSMDPGPNAGLEPFLRGKEEELSRRFGFPVSFLFLRLTEDEDPGSRTRRVPPRARLRRR
jgi:hypothetical protein